MKRPTEQQLTDLFDAFLELRTREDVQLFLADLCTKKEVEQMAARLYAARLLTEGSTYVQAIEETSLSSATISRVSQCIQYGEGYRLVLKEPVENKRT